MKPAQRKQLEQKLLALLEEVEKKQPARIEPNRTSDVDVVDDDAQPLNEMLQTIASTRNRTLGGLTARAQKALKKLREEPDDFGLCEQCEDEIAFPRLAAMPYAELCVDCQAEQDGPKGPKTRKNLTDFR